VSDSDAGQLRRAQREVHLAAKIHLVEAAQSARVDQNGHVSDEPNDTDVRPRPGHIDTAGARLYFEVQGSGQPLVLIHGSGGDTESHADVMTLLAEHYTVVTYDRRGNGRSILSDPDATVTLTDHGDDAADLLRDFDAVLDTDRRDGPLPAAAEFFLATGALGPARNPLLEIIAQAVAARPVPPFREIHPILDYAPDLDTLRQRADRLVVAAGRAQPESMPYRAGHALADALGLPLALFPGNHFGYMQLPGINDPAAFAEVLREHLEDRAPE